MSDPIHQAHAYKCVEDCEISLDLYPAADGRAWPLVVCIHGGALMGGTRETYPPAHIRKALLPFAHVASVDYRLAPETKLPEIVEDLYDALAWLRARAPSLCGVDTSRLAVLGGSAGGYLTLMAGLAEPRPCALVAFYGYGDLTGTWYSRPDPFYCRLPEVSQEDAFGSVGCTAISSASFTGSRRGPFYLYCRQHGLWPHYVAGWNPDAEPERFWPYEPVRMVTADYPPTMLLHGDADTDVPYAQSVAMAEALRGASVEHELVTFAGAGHGFDQDPHAAATQEATARVTAFLKRHLRVAERDAV